MTGGSLEEGVTHPHDTGFTVTPEYRSMNGHTELLDDQS